jgi:hypothetical protein
MKPRQQQQQQQSMLQVLGMAGTAGMMHRQLQTSKSSSHRDSRRLSGSSSGSVSGGQQLQELLLVLLPGWLSLSLSCQMPGCNRGRHGTGSRLLSS